MPKDIIYINVYYEYYCTYVQFVISKIKQSKNILRVYIIINFIVHAASPQQTLR